MMHTHGEGDIESVADLFPGVGWGGIPIVFCAWEEVCTYI